MNRTEVIEGRAVVVSDESADELARLDESIGLAFSGGPVNSGLLDELDESIERVFGPIAKEA